MARINIEATDYIDESRQDINDNFTELYADKADVSGQVFTGPVSFSGTTNSGLKVNSLTTAQRDALTPANGMVIYNTTTARIESYENGAWVATASIQLASFTYGETIAVNDAVYVKSSDGYIYKCDADDDSKLGFIGFAKEAGNLGATGSVQVLGVTNGFTSLTIGGVYYLSGTLGGITTTAPTNSIYIGTAISATQILIEKKTSKITRFYTSNATWTKPAGLKYIEVEGVGGGGGSGSVNSGASNGAGGGAYAKKQIFVGALGATETVTIGAGGRGEQYNGQYSTDGGTTSFGAHISCGGGSRTTYHSYESIGYGGTASGGDLNVPGGSGGYRFSASGVSRGGAGGSSFFGSSGNGAGVAYGCGGCGSASSSTDGGFGGANGIVIVTEYF